MENIYNNRPIKSLNPFLGFGWNTKTTLIKEGLNIKHKKFTFKNE
ncbi:hypothetical protein [Flavivirga spongiicola]|uniref:Uncharacterized protein n=1 Tax=Flavivirga spongiicola TaxID=421621 RepID=A0ABU7XYY2_9FLAO|nr:hypothetical protein [Flavivirga sp. MEBiC05379]MDO5980984.1 hypothetical protein [Flavivirga sp. MEBiC05379]